MNKKELAFEDIDLMDFMLRWRGAGNRFQEDRWPEHFFELTDLYAKELPHKQFPDSIQEVIDILCAIYEVDSSKTHLRYAMKLKLMRDLDI